MTPHVAAAWGGPGSGECVVGNLLCSIRVGWLPKDTTGQYNGQSHTFNSRRAYTIHIPFMTVA